MGKKYGVFLVLLLMSFFLAAGTCSAGIADDVKAYASKEKVESEINQIGEDAVGLVRGIAGTVAVLCLAVAFFMIKFSSDTQKVLKAKMALGGVIASLFVVYKTEFLVGAFLGIFNVTLK